MDIGMIVTFAGIVVAGLAGVLGVWMERDPEAPPRWAWVFSVLILVATGIEMAHSTVQAAEDGETEEAMARVLEQLTIISAHSDNPALASFVSSELAAQARNNPGVVAKLEKKVAAKGGDVKAIRRQAAAGRTGRPVGAKAGGKAGAGARTGSKATGKAGAKAGGSKSGGKADGKGGKADGKSGGKADGKSGGKADSKSSGKADSKSSKSDNKGGSSSGSKSSGKSDSKSSGSKSKGKGN
jgi:hypothetical protein